MFSQEELKNLLGDMELNEGTLQALTALVESHTQTTVQAAVDANTTALNEAHTAEIVKMREDANRYGEYIKEEITAKVGEYTNYAVQEFITENKEQFALLETHEKTVAALDAIKNAFETHGFSLNENVELNTANKELEDSKTAFANLFEELKDVKGKLVLAEMAIIFDEATRNLAETQREKVRNLSESVTFETKEDFAKGLALIVGQVTNVQAPPAPLNEEVKELTEDEKRRKSYVEAMRKNK